MSVIKISEQFNPIWYYVIVNIVIVATLIVLAKILPRFKKTRWSSLIIISLAITVIIFSIFNIAKDHHSKTLMTMIENSSNVTDLHLTDNELEYCSNSYHGSLNAGTWKTGNTQRVGVLVGKKEDDKCVYSLKNIKPD